MKLILTCLTIISLSFNTVAQNLGTAVPNVVFYNKDNSQFSTHSIPKGKKSFVFFFDATCSHCQKVIAEFNKRYKELSNVNLYMVSQDEYRSIDYFTSNFAKQLSQQKNVKVLQDRDKVFIMAFRPKKYPAMYFYGADRNLQFTSSEERDVAKIFQLAK